MSSETKIIYFKTKNRIESIEFNISNTTSDDLKGIITALFLLLLLANEFNCECSYS
jgi:hypothetical protein